jgi:hypothetical protein
MDRTVLRKLWRRRIDDLIQSGLSIRAFSERHGFSRDQIRYWQRYFAAQDGDQASAFGEWLPVEIAEGAVAQTRGRLTLRIAGAAIEIDPGFDPALLRSVVLALAPPC